MNADVLKFVIYSCGTSEASHDFVVCGNATAEASMLLCKIFVYVFIFLIFNLFLCKLLFNIILFCRRQNNL